MNLLESTFTKNEKDMITDFQKSEGLAYGGLTEELFDYLNIKY